MCKCGHKHETKMHEPESWEEIARLCKQRDALVILRSTGYEIGHWSTGQSITQQIELVNKYITELTT